MEGIKLRGAFQGYVLNATVNRTFLTVMLLFNIFSLQITAMFPLFHKSAGTRSTKFFIGTCRNAVEHLHRFYAWKQLLLSAHLSHCNSVCPTAVTQVDQAKAIQARITKSSPSAAYKTLVLGTVKLFHKFEGGHPERGC